MERVWVWATAALVAAPTLAHAQTQPQVTLGVTAGFTDNVTSAPQGTPPPAGPAADSFGEVTPGISLAHASRRAVVRIGYTFDGTHYFQHSEADAYANQLDLTSLFVTSPTTQLLLGVNAAQGRTNAFSLQQFGAAEQIQALPPGGVSYVRLGAVEGFAKDFSPVVRGTQGLAFTAYAPYGEDIFAARTYDVTSTLGLERSFSHDAIGGELRNTYFDVEPFTGPPPDHTDNTRQQELINALVARWRHDIGRYWASELDLGILEVMRADDFGGRIWQPTGLAAMRYVRQEGQAELVYTHGAQANTYLGQIFLTDEVMLHGAIPLGQSSGVTLIGTNGFLYGRGIDADGNFGVPIDVLLLDVALAWAPTASVTFTGRYQRFQQLGEDQPDAAVPLIVRNTFTLTVTLAYPPNDPRLPIYRPPVRVDRSDEIGAPADLAPPLEEEEHHEEQRPGPR